MIRKIAKMTACFAAGLFALTLGVGAGHSKTGVIAKLKTAVKGEKWDDAAAAGKELKELGEALAANKAPKGDAASWTKLATKYKDNTAAASAAADKKDAAGVTKALGGINCKECHDAHK
jgi:mono/diheme cytochrome c family protein